jgi:hypothetical protein
MKRLLLIFLLLILITAAFLYSRIPATQNYAYGIAFRCTENGAIRQLHDSSKWDLWWPGKKTNHNTYRFANRTFNIREIILPGIATSIDNNGDSVKAFFQVSKLKPDSTIFQWGFTYAYSSNPIKRIQQYIRLKSLKTDLKNFIVAVKPYFEKEENIYGMKIEQQKVKDSSLISMKQTFDHYPATADIYQMVRSLKVYVDNKKGEQTNPPMLNVFPVSETSYEVMVAIPTKWDLPEEGSFKLKKMVLGNILVGEVKGGLSTVMNAEKQMANYVFDYGKASPAIPFQSLVTDRSLESDSSKWITRLNYPIFY